MHASLKRAEGMILADRPPAEEVILAIRRHLAEDAPDGIIDYVQIVDPSELSDVEQTDSAVCIALAVKFGRARLIDNLFVDAPPSDG